MARKKAEEQVSEALEEGSFEVQEAEYAGDLLRDVSAQTVDMVQSGAQSIVADTVHLEQAMATTINAQQADIAQSFVVSADADEVHATNSIMAAVRSQEAQVSEGAIGVVLGSDVALDESVAGVVVASAAHVSGGRTGLLLARHVDGEVTTVLDTRTALGLGAMLGAVFGAFTLLAVLLSRRR